MINWAKSDPMCGPNQLEYPPGSTPLYQIFEEYAADQQKWVDDFFPTMEKMLSNGYDDLVQGPDQTTGVACNRIPLHTGGTFTNCYKPSLITGILSKKNLF